MDLASLDITTKAEDGVEMHLLHPITNEDTGIVMVLRGASSKVVKAALAKYRKVSEDERKSDADKERAASDFLTKCIIEMRGATYNGEPVESTTENIKWFIDKFPWASPQITEFINELENFLPENDSD